MKMTTGRKKAFLEELSKHGLVTIASKVASPHSEKGCHVTFYEERSRDPEFARAWEEALVIADEATIKELHRRGIEGYEKPVWGSLGSNQGTGQVGTETVYSDKMAELYGRVSSMRIRNALTNRIEHSGSVSHEAKIDLRSLSPEKRALLEQLLEPDDSPE